MRSSFPRLESAPSRDASGRTVLPSLGLSSAFGAAFFGCGQCNYHLLTNYIPVYETTSIIGLHRQLDGLGIRYPLVACAGKDALQRERHNPVSDGQIEPKGGRKRG
jgi:hypothetical protein